MIITFGDKKYVSKFIGTLHDSPSDDYFCFVYHKDEIKKMIKGKKKLVLVWDLLYLKPYLNRKMKN